MKRNARKHRVAGVILAIMVASEWPEAVAEVIQEPHTTRLKVENPQSPAGTVDFAHAIPLPPPTMPAPAGAAGLVEAFTAQPESQFSAVPSYSPGAHGNGRRNPMMLPVAAQPTTGVAPQEFGTTEHPFSTARNDAPRDTNTSFPARAAGRLFFNIGNSSYVCSASLIKRGLVVTAAHCVADFGNRQYYSNWHFVPGYRDGSAPYGIWSASSAVVSTSYYEGSDPCAATGPGVVCQNDIGVLTLSPQNGAYAGTNTGWYGFGWDGYGFTSGSMLAQITQIGYPVCLDNGLYQERNDSVGYTSSANQNNTLIGSLMCGGSSGGPWLVNFGKRPTLTGGTAAGTFAEAHVVVGVTSWGYVDSGPKQMGASPFTSGNIKALVDAACKAAPAACS